MPSGIHASRIQWGNLFDLAIVIFGIVETWKRGWLSWTSESRPSKDVGLCF